MANYNFGCNIAHLRRRLPELVALIVDTKNKKGDDQLYGFHYKEKVAIVRVVETVEWLSTYKMIISTYTTDLNRSIPISNTCKINPKALFN